MSHLLADYAILILRRKLIMEKEISDKQYYKIIKPIFMKNKQYFTNQCLSKYIAYYIDNMYKNGLLKNNDLSIIIKSSLDIIYNIKLSDCNINEIKEILKKNYHLDIINDNPVLIKEI